MKRSWLISIYVLTLGLGISNAQSTQPNSETGKVKAIAVNTRDLEAFSYDAGKVKFIASSEDTNGAFGVLEVTEMPGYKTTWHRHNHTEETFYILEGVLTVKIGDKVSEYPAGSYVLVPRATPHGQGNFSKDPVRFILTVTPGGYERRFRERSARLSWIRRRCFRRHIPSNKMLRVAVRILPHCTTSRA